MDAVKFLKERNRMCESFGDRCAGCPAFNVREGYVGCCAVDVESTLDATAQVAIIEKWSTEHPRKTKQDIFLEQWPETKVGDNGILTLCPAVVSSTHRSQYGGCKTLSALCDDCCREFWTQEVK